MTTLQNLLIAALLTSIAGCATPNWPTDMNRANPSSTLHIEKTSSFYEPKNTPLSIKPLSAQSQAAFEDLEPVKQAHKGIAAGSIRPVAKPLALPVQPLWTLTADRLVGQELKAWGLKAGWKVIWALPKDWSVPASSQFTGDFPTAASEVIQTLAANGALIRAQFFEGNKTLVVSGPGVLAQ